MNKHDIDKLVRWSVDSDLKKFAEELEQIKRQKLDQEQRILKNLK